MPAHMKVTNTSKDLLASNEDGASTQSGFIQPPNIEEGRVIIEYLEL